VQLVLRVTAWICAVCRKSYCMS